jgi:2-amino-4-hydroxy-6-hydroxymethyldihydropteridine diphosphokinase
LILPHPRLHERAFVLGPLMEIAPEWRHPVLGLSVAQMFGALPNALRAELRAL